MDQIRIQSDGDGTNTVITTADGSVIPYVTAALIQMGAKEINTVSLDITMPILDVHATPESHAFTCPCCGVILTHCCTPR